MAPAILITVLAVLLFLSCADNGLGPANTGTIRVTVGVGMTPSISWDGGPVYSVAITEGTGGIGAPLEEQYYHIATPGHDNLASPVAYGSTPTGAVVIASKDLASGKTYTCQVTRVDGEYGTVQFSR